MLRNNKYRLNNTSHLTLFSLCTFLLLQTGCGGGSESNSEASAIGIQDVSVAYIKRPTPRNNNGNIISNDMRRPDTFTAGGDLYLQARASSTAAVKNVTGSITKGVGDVKDVSVSYDGTKLLFSLQLEDPNPNDDILFHWYLYEYDIPSDTLTQLTSAGADDGDDISPQYLPEDGRIIFASTRRPESKGILTNEGHEKFFATDENRSNSAFSLHIREENGDISQVTFNQSNDLDPIVLRDSGRILFSRWNHMGSRNDVSLYSMNPDGTDIQLYYGAHSHRTGQNSNSDVHFSKPRETQDGRILTLLRPLVSRFGSGDTIFIDGKNFADNTQPTWAQQGVTTGTAQSNLKQNINTATGLSIKGRYNATFPLLDGTNRYLMSWSPCQILVDPTIAFDAANPTANTIPCTLATDAQLTDSAVTEAPPSFGVFLVDGSSNTQVPLVLSEADTLINEVVMTYAVTTPPIIFDKVAGVSTEIIESFATDGVGVLHIRSVYDLDDNFTAYGATLPTLDTTSVAINIDTPMEMANPKNTTADQRPARFIRITKGVSLPDRDFLRLVNTAFGRSTQQGMREIVGYAPIEPDGSVKIKVPANVPLTISILDKDGRRISNRHQSWFQVKPGETLECVGCHLHNTSNQAGNKPHGRPNLSSTFNSGSETTGIGYPNSLDSLWGEIGETMAETRARHSCSASPTCPEMKPSTDLVYTDVWTNDVAANRSADTSYTIDYSDVPTSPIDNSSRAAIACNKPYIVEDKNPAIDSFTYCRVIINYEQHIEPIWTTANNRPNGSCISCHNQADNEADLLDPTKSTHSPLSYQLNLVSAPKTDDPFYKSYTELSSSTPKYINKDGVIEIEKTQRIIGGVPQFILLPDGTPDLTNPIMDDVTVPGSIGRGLGNGTDRALNTYFMEKILNTELEETNRSLSDFTQQVDHTGYLTPSELKLISEWLDIGAQYFNNPFDPAAPTN